MAFGLAIISQEVLVPEAHNGFKSPGGELSMIFNSNSWITSHLSVAAVVLFVLLLSISCGFVPPACAQERASDADYARLAGDLVTIARAQAREDAANTAALLKTRQQQLLGEDTNSIEALVRDTRDWWLKNILNPFYEVASNPAASCELSQQLLVKVLGMESQAQKFGLSDPEFGSITSPESVLSKSVRLVKRRCLEEAYDECMSTGNGAALIALTMGWERQLQLLGLEDPAFGEQAAYLFRRCTVYKVKFHSENHVTAHYTLESTFDGSVNMLFEFGEGSDFFTRIGNGEWKGPTKAEEAAPDLMITNLICQPSSFYTCDSSGAFGTGPSKSHGKVLLKRFHRETVVGPDNKPQIRTIESGENSASLEFTMPLATAPAKYYSRGAVVFQTRMEIGGTAFSLVHSPANNQTVNLTSWTREGYNTLFSKEISANKTDKKITYANKTKFEIIHRPDLYPADQINPKFELTPKPQDETPPRKPAVSNPTE